MSNTIAFILAAGDATRINRAKKQLLPMRHTTILKRMLAQMKMHKQRVIVVTHDDEIASNHDRAHNPKNRDTVCDSLLSTAHLWDDRTIVLLGDVVYTHEIMDTIVNNRDPIRVFGTTWEIFAIVFDKKLHSGIKNALRRGSKHRRGKLRYFYRSYCGFDFDCREKEAKPLEDRVFYYVRDWTRDIDSQYEYDRLMIEVVDAGLL